METFLRIPGYLDPYDYACNVQKPFAKVGNPTGNNTPAEVTDRLWSDEPDWREPLGQNVRGPNVSHTCSKKNLDYDVKVCVTSKVILFKRFRIQFEELIWVQRTAVEFSILMS